MHRTLSRPMSSGMGAVESMQRCRLIFNVQGMEDNKHLTTAKLGLQSRQFRHLQTKGRR